MTPHLQITLGLTKSFLELEETTFMMARVALKELKTQREMLNMLARISTLPECEDKAQLLCDLAKFSDRTDLAGLEQSLLTAIAKKESLSDQIAAGVRSCEQNAPAEPETPPEDIES